MEESSQGNQTNLTIQRQLDLLNLICFVGEQYLNQLLLSLPESYWKMFQTILNKSISVILLQGIHLSHLFEEQLIKQDNESLLQHKEQIEAIREKLHQLKSSVFSLLQRNYHQYKESQARFFAEKLLVAVDQGGYDALYFESIIANLTAEAITVMKFIINQNGTFLFQKDRIYLEFAALLSLLSVSNFTYVRQLPSPHEISLMHMDYLQEIIINADEFLTKQVSITSLE